MALIKCEECGQMISDKATECPNCGAPVEVKTEEKGLICEECGQTVPANATECPNCGCPVDRKLFCEECGEEISSSMDECPNCGCPITKKESRTTLNALKEIIGEKLKKRPYTIRICALFFVVLLCGIVCLCLRGAKGGTVKITPEFCKAIKKYDILCGFHEGLAAVRDNNGKWGFINKKGKLVIPCKYDNKNYDRSEYLYDCSEGLIGVSERSERSSSGYVCGFIDKKGNTVIPLIYGNIGNFSEGLAAAQDAASGEWGYIDRKGHVVIPFKYYRVGDFSCGLGAVIREEMQEIGGKRIRVVEFINKKNELVESLWARYSYDEPKYDEASAFDFSNGYPPLHVKFVNNICNVCEYGKFHWIDKNGNKADAPQQEYIAFGEKDKTVGNKLGEMYFIPSKHGYKDRDGNIVIPAKYSYLGKFHNGVAVATLLNNYTCNADMYPIYGYVDKYGNETFSQEDYKKIEEASKEVVEKCEEAKRERLAEEERKRREEEEARKREEEESVKSWLQGSWIYRNSYGVFRADISGDYLVVTISGERTYSGSYTIEGNRIVYDRWDMGYDYMQFDRDRKCIVYDDGTPFQRISGSSSSGGSSSRGGGRSASQSFYGFTSPSSVIAYTNERTFYSGSSSVRLTYQGLYVNGTCCSGAPIVVSYSSNEAVVRVNTIASGTLTLRIYPNRGLLVDNSGREFYCR